MKSSALSAPPGQQVIEGEVVSREFTAATPTQFVQARVAPRPLQRPVAPQQPQPQQPQIRVQLGDSVALALPTGLQGVAIAAGAVLVWKFVLPKVAEYLGSSRSAQRKRRRIKTGGT